MEKNWQIVCKRTLEEPGGLHEAEKVRHDWVTNTHTHIKYSKNVQVTPKETGKENKRKRKIGKK